MSEYVVRHRRRRDRAGRSARMDRHPVPRPAVPSSATVRHIGVPLMPFRSPLAADWRAFCAPRTPVRRRSRAPSVLVLPRMPACRRPVALPAARFGLRSGLDRDQAAVPMGRHRLVGPLGAPPGSRSWGARPPNCAHAARSASRAAYRPADGPWRGVERRVWRRIAYAAGTPGPPSPYSQVSSSARFSSVSRSANV